MESTGNGKGKARTAGASAKYGLKKKQKKGVELIEFAVVAPVFLMLILGGVDIAWFMFQWTVINYAAYEGAKVAARTPNLTGGAAPQEVEDEVERRVNIFLRAENNDIEVSVMTPDFFPEQNRYFHYEAKIENYEPLFGSLVPGLTNIDEITTGKRIMYYEAVT